MIFCRGGAGAGTVHHDESDSGLDIDALKLWRKASTRYRDDKRAFDIVTHYQPHTGLHQSLKLRPCRSIGGRCPIRRFYSGQATGEQGYGWLTEQQ